MGRRSFKKRGDKKEDRKPSSKPFFTPANDPVKNAMQTAGEPIPTELKSSLGSFLQQDLDNISIHNNAASQQAANNVQARAFTVGSQVHLGSDALSLDGEEKNNLLAHEIVHAVQQSEATADNNLTTSNPKDSQEIQAQSIANQFSLSPNVGTKPVISKQNKITIHRDIKDSKELKHGTMEIAFTKSEAEAEGDYARETGLVKFRPNDQAPESDSIRMIQIVRTIDMAGKNAGKPIDWSKIGKGEEADRNKVSTTADKSKGVEGDFYVDHFARKADPRTKASDAEVLPYYNAWGPGTTGKKKKGEKTTVASIRDAPGSNDAMKFSFVSAAKGTDNNIWYGSAVWGFEIYTEKGKAKIRNEYKSFREDPGATLNAAVEKFNTFYKNPGTVDAP